jgi:hypothetical protein
MLAKAVAAESGSNFLHVSLSDVMQEFVGMPYPAVASQATTSLHHTPLSCHCGGLVFPHSAWARSRHPLFEPP